MILFILFFKDYVYKFYGRWKLDVVKDLYVLEFFYNRLEDLRKLGG